MSTYFLVHLSTPAAPENLAEAHAADELYLNVRGRPSDFARAARLESEDLARAMREACVAPLKARYGDEVTMKLRQANGDGADDAQRIANDSNAARDWLVSQPAS
ncbi:hypothetical protein [Pseudomarimonas salicorniae]|uniref:Uncharacterized protein n=1 Tax=Pseudomarimonas salicorniae TaxID=2933270 RepID=A0ABT0GCC3_9GAMM|nr:hypothetical protein [Lysobacter sp. CAU 1642]MCK7592186.1 hypothetical protein [Lysobacter sp. CAU 1642]